jgi:SAM-dependent methyltransferase
LPPEFQPPAASLEASADGRRFTPATARNLAPLTAALADLVPAAGRVLEVASGSGQHVTHWAAAFPGLDFQPSDPDPVSRTSIVAWTAHAGVANVRPPLALDLAEPDWWRGLEAPFDLVVAVNLTHISPWPVTLGLLAGAAALLRPGGRLVIYGPFAENAVLEPESNRRFDAVLRAENPAWGVRDVADLDAAATACGLARTHRITLPANNLVLVWERTPCA